MSKINITVDEQDFRDMKIDIKSILEFIALQKAINDNVKINNDRLDKIEKDYVSWGGLKTFAVGLITLFTLLSFLGVRTAFLDGYSKTNESNQELQKTQKEIINKQSDIINKLEKRLEK